MKYLTSCLILSLLLISSVSALTIDSSAGWLINASTHSTISGSNCPVNCSCNLSLDNVNVENPFSLVFPAGIYSFLYQTNINDTCTSDSVSNTLISQIGDGVIIYPPAKHRCMINRFVFRSPDVPILNGYPCPIPGTDAWNKFWRIH